MSQAAKKFPKPPNFDSGQSISGSSDNLLCEVFLPELVRGPP